MLIFRFYTIQYLNSSDYKKLLSNSGKSIVDGPSTPRGRIYDRNMNLLVDNQAIRTIFYKKPKSVKSSDEIELALLISNEISLPYDKVNDSMLREYFVMKNKDIASNKITEEDRILLKQRKITNKDIENYKRDRLTQEDLDLLDENDRKAAYVYNLMNKGYSYEEKIIKNVDVTDKEYAYISENVSVLSGFNTRLDWDRIYLYDNVFKNLYGKVSNNNQGIPKELKDEYLEKGYALTDRVGLSYLEFQYEDYLKGKKAKYTINSDNSYSLIEEGSRGNDIVLTIDIKLQMQVEKIIEEELLNAKSEPNTEFYNSAFAIITDPKTGEILAISSKQIVNQMGVYSVVDNTQSIFTSPITVGSVVKGASMIVGYNNKAIDINTTMLDECIKIKGTPKKCSWKEGLGVLNDLDALRLSSNSYQFKTAIKVANASYGYDQSLAIDEGAFTKYRDVFSEFGLGVKTEIDLPFEITGYKGTSTNPGHLLDFAIGQYDNYTAIQLSQYINTIGNSGNRLKLELLKSVYSSESNLTNKIFDYTPVTLNSVNTDAKYMDRIRLGFKEVMKPSGLGYNYMGYAPDPAGKTGTAQSFLDTDLDGKIDTETLNSSFAGYAPSDDPRMGIVVISPNISHPNGRTEFISLANKRITSRISNFFFENY